MDVRAEARTYPTAEFSRSTFSPDGNSPSWPIKSPGYAATICSYSWPEADGKSTHSV
jgi:hypothetical protein